MGMSCSSVFARVALDLADCDHHERAWKRWQPITELEVREFSARVVNDKYKGSLRSLFGLEVHAVEVQGLHSTAPQFWRSGQPKITRTVTTFFTLVPVLVVQSTR